MEAERRGGGDGGAGVLGGGAELDVHRPGGGGRLRRQAAGRGPAGLR